MRLGRARGDVRGGDLIAALDVGASKVCCLIAVADPRGAAQGCGPLYPPPPGMAPGLKVLGLGHHRSAGIHAGAPVDLAAARQAIGAAITQAEQIARLRLESIHVAVNAPRLRSTTFNGHVDLAGTMVTDGDLAVLETGAAAYPAGPGEVLLGLNRITYTLDGIRIPGDPRGLAGHRLGSNHHAVVADEGPIRNLVALIESCQIEPTGLVPSPLASALAVTSEAERQAGVTVVDLGASLTSYASFAEGHLVLCGAIELGGQQMTDDLARLLGSPLAEAERIKTLYGTVASSLSDEHDVLSYSGVASSDGMIPRTTRAHVAAIVRSRMISVLQAVGDRLQVSQAAGYAGSRIVMTGGASQIMGLGDFAATLLGRPVRLAGPVQLQGHAGGGLSPVFSCVAGVALCAQQPERWLPAELPVVVSSGSYVGRIERWLRDSF